MADRPFVHFSLHLGPFPEESFLVRRIDGVEELSTPFAMAITFSTVDGEPLDLFRLISREACLAIRHSDSPGRWLHGICATAEHAGTFAGRPLYRATIAPKLQFLSVKANCRVFQDQSSVDIVCSLLQKAGIDFRRELRGTYPVREMCIQYRETDLSFISRLLADEGITYWFEHAERQHTLVLGDAPESFGPLPDGDQLPFRHETEVTAEAHLFGLRRKSSVRPSRSTLRDFDFEHPSLDVTSSTPPSRGGEVFDYPSGNVQAVETKRLSQVRLEELQAEVETWKGRTNCEHLGPGCTFGLTGHPRSDFDVRLVATRVMHRGMQQTGSGDAHSIEATYRNEFHAIRANCQYRPPRETSRPTIRGVQTATVVGPSGEEVHPDQHGRVKVQFRWDRVGRLDDRASAWVRLAQSWSGPGFGALFVPRIGQEVVLRFLEGNPDRPIVTGAVYNGQHPPPVGLPADKTQSTLRTDSSPHNGGSNELRFEDAADQEQVYLHGQKDETVEVGNDKDQVVHRNEQLRVDQNRSRSVGGNQALEVTQNDGSRVQGNKSANVAWNRSTVVSGSHSEAISGSHSGTVSGMRDVTVRLASTEMIGAANALTIGGAYAVSVAGAMNEAVGGFKNCEVAGAKIEVVGASRTETVGGDYLATVGSAFETEIAGGLDMKVGKNLSENSRNTRVSGDAASWSARTIHITGDEIEILIAGKIAIIMKKDGTFQMFGTTITVQGAAVSAKGATLSKIGPAAAIQKRLDQRKANAIRSARALARFRLVDQDGQPVVNQHFTIRFSNGAQREGATDGQGRVKMPAPTSAPFRMTLQERAPVAPELALGARPSSARTKGARLVEYGKNYDLAMGREHIFELPERRSILTISMLFPERVDDNYPRYILDSTDGSYHKELSPKDNVATDKGRLRLTFTELRAGKSYNLIAHLGPATVHPLFQDLPYEHIVDMPRPHLPPIAGGEHARAHRGDVLPLTEPVRHHE
jgi:type VI secretion system secreted protein VgrG